MDKRVKLIEVRGDDGEFDDLIDLPGTLSTTVFDPDESNDWLDFRPRSRFEDGGKITIETSLGNTFIFQVL